MAKFEAVSGGARVSLRWMLSKVLGVCLAGFLVVAVGMLVSGRGAGIGAVLGGFAAAGVGGVLGLLPVWLWGGDALGVVRGWMLGMVVRLVATGGVAWFVVSVVGLGGRDVAWWAIIGYVLCLVGETYVVSVVLRRMSAAVSGGDAA